jgi:hypothetical protein
LEWATSRITNSKPDIPESRQREPRPHHVAGFENDFSKDILKKHYEQTNDS